MHSATMARSTTCAILWSLAAILATALPMMAVASDADPLQDFCVADLGSKIVVNGLVCKSPDAVTVNDFVFKGLDKPGNTNNPTGNAVTPVFAAQLPGLNTLGISLARLDFAKGGINVPHVHPRATEVLVVLEGSLYVGFMSTANKLFATTLHKGDVFVFPKGLVHFQLNVGSGPAVAIAGLNSQNPGVQQVARALFGSDPMINDVVLEKTFGLNEKAVKHIRTNFKS